MSLVVGSSVVSDALKQIKRQWTLFKSALDPLDEDIKHVEARCGASVAAYFKFNRSVIMAVFFVRYIWVAHNSWYVFIGDVILFVLFLSGLKCRSWVFEIYTFLGACLVPFYTFHFTHMYYP